VPSVNAIAKQIQANTPKRGFWAKLSGLFKDAALLSVIVVAGLVVAVAISVGVGFWKKWRDPKPMIVVLPFEESTDAAKTCGMTGKNAEDIFVDRLNELTAKAAEYHGNVYASKNSLGKLPEQPKIPVETAYGISVHGVSVDDIIRLYNRVRYDQWNVSGDVMAERKRCRVRARLTRADNSSEWESIPGKGQSLTDTIRQTAVKLIAAAHPELAGRALLQEIIDRKNAGVDASPIYGQTEDAFRGWIASRPQDVRAYTYLTTAYYYEGKPQQALYVANWVQELPGLRQRMEQEEAARRSVKLSADPVPQPSASEDSPEDRMAMIAATAKLTRGGTVDEMKAVKDEFDRLALSHPGDARCYLNAAVASEAIAVAMGRAAEGRTLTAAEREEIRRRYEEAVQLFLHAEWIDPENAGLHRDIGEELNAFAFVEGRPNPPQTLDELRYALHLLPSFREAYATSTKLMNASGQTAQADELCQTLQLLTLPVDGKPYYECAAPTKARVKRVRRHHS
jgi:tetratricopeptide (TPR) repeat protein